MSLRTSAFLIGLGSSSIRLKTRESSFSILKLDTTTFKKAFFNRYYFGIRGSQNYGRFISKQAARGHSVLSIDSGRCANGHRTAPGWLNVQADI